MYDLLISGGTVVDAASGTFARRDIAVTGGLIADVAPDLRGRGARRAVDATGHWVLPGLVDTHVHVCGPFAGAEGYRMMARAGVTTALDLAGNAGDLVAGLKRAGAGQTMAFLVPLVPGDTVTSPAPADAEIARVRDDALASGALGVKVLGGHYPLTPEATAAVIRLAQDARCWCAVHAGTTATPGDIDGMEELIALAEGRPLHVPHINSYCRGQRSGDPIGDTARAIRALAATPSAVSESYLARINGASAAIAGGAPKSNVVKRCLQQGGFDATRDGMVAAIRAGWAQIHGVRDGEIVLLDPPEGLAEFERRETNAGVSFAVNEPAVQAALAVAKRHDGRWAVDALSTDGGGIPRNTTLRQGLALIHFGALTPVELVDKACLAGARMLGLPAKGRIHAGADADVVITDPQRGDARWVFAHGEPIVDDGRVVGQGGRVATTPQGEASLRAQGLSTMIAAAPWI